MKQLQTLVLSMVVCVAALGLKCSHANAATVSLTWTAPADDGSDCASGLVTGYDIRYSTAMITEANFAAATQASGSGAFVPTVCGDTETFTVEGLAPNTTYYFAVKAVDDVGNWSPMSNVATVTTPDVIAPAAIIDLRAVTN